MEIKHKLTGEIILRIESLYEANLYGADLRVADLYKADLRGADLRGANLYGADLYKADLYGRPLNKNPIFIIGLIWDVTITDFHMKIGCQIHTVEAWCNFSDDEISRMESRALKFWKTYREHLLTLCKTQASD